MKKTYFAPELQEFRFLTEELMAFSGGNFAVDPDDNSSSGGDDDTTTLLPFSIF